MEIKIDESMMQKTLDDTASQAVQNAMSGFVVRNALEKAVADSVLPGLLSQAIVDAADKIDIDALTEALAKQMSRSITKGVQLVVQDSMVSMILKLRGVPDYDKEKLALGRATILAELAA